ncbi:hypothetical protein Q3H58_004564 [Pseudomonas psychrotolerans]|nr:hypothetical protein [Pseudomonas psychrotolerans]
MARALFAQDPGLGFQLGLICRAIGQGMRGSAEHHQFVLDPGLHF